MKTSLLLLTILILNLGLTAQVITKFSWNRPLAPIGKADFGPDAVSVSTGAVASFISLVSGVANNGISPGPTAKDIDLTLPNSTYFNTPSLDISIDFRREETEASFLSRGSLFEFGMNGGKLAVKFNVANGMGSNTTINSGNVYDIPNDHLFHNYRFMYDNTTGLANIWVDGIVRYSYSGTANRALYWTGAGSPVIGKQMDATGRNVAVLDNFEMRTIPVALVLPVKFTTFTLVAKANDTHLSWSVANEENLKQYTVERSIDGLRFETAGAVTPKSGTSLTKSYEFKVASSAGSASYRIKAVDNDGKALYSDVKTISPSSAKESKISCFPNPVLEVINVSFTVAEITKFTTTLYTQDGRRIQTDNHEISKGSSTVALKLSSKVPHNAILILVIENNKSAAKDVKQIIRK